MSQNNIEELIKAYDEYIKLLEQECGSFGAFAFTHGIGSSEENVAKGEELRQRIRELKTANQP